MRETHGNMQVPAARSASSMIVSRWSISPSSTLTSHVPHTPREHEVTASTRDLIEEAYAADVALYRSVG